MRQYTHPKQEQRPKLLSKVVYASYGTFSDIAACLQSGSLSTELQCVHWVAACPLSGSVATEWQSVYRVVVCSQSDSLSIEWHFIYRVAVCLQSGSVTTEWQFVTEWQFLFVSTRFWSTYYDQWRTLSHLHVFVAPSPAAKRGRNSGKIFEVSF